MSTYHATYYENLIAQLFDSISETIFATSVTYLDSRLCYKYVILIEKIYVYLSQTTTEIHFGTKSETGKLDDFQASTFTSTLSSVCGASDELELDFHGSV